MRSLILFVSITVFPVLLGTPIRKESLRLWKTPQGQMLTWVREHECLHFDVGGTIENFRDITKLCQQRKHLLFLSHNDREHLKLLARFRGSPINLSHADVDIWRPKKIIARTGPKPPLPRSQEEDQKSWVFFLKQPKVLVVGDSPIEQEKEFLEWAQRRRPLILILGNHGRARSTSQQLLARLPSIKSTWASSMGRNRTTRLQEFIHSGRVPRRNRIDLKTKKNLLSHGLPVVGTHDWGTISLY